MKNITATITTSYDIKNPDQAPQIEELGYNPETAKSYALQALNMNVLPTLQARMLAKRDTLRNASKLRA